VTGFNFGDRTFDQCHSLWRKKMVEVFDFFPIAPLLPLLAHETCFLSTFDTTTLNIHRLSLARRANGLFHA